RDRNVTGVQTCALPILMPGLIDMHWHSMLAGLNQTRALTSPIGYLYYTAAAEAERTLMRGFTTIRDAGGPSFALKSAIDEGLIRSEERRVGRERRRNVV